MRSEKKGEKRREARKWEKTKVEEEHTRAYR